MKTIATLPLVFVLCFVAGHAQQAAYGVPQDNQISRAYGGSLIVQLRTLLFNGSLFDDWDQVLELKFGPPSGKVPSNIPGLYLKMLRLNDVSYCQLVSGSNQVCRLSSR